MLSEEKSNLYIEQVFNIWLEQKVIREHCRGNLGQQELSMMDLKSVALNFDEQYLGSHKLLEVTSADDIMNLNAFEPEDSDLGKNRKTVLKNYIQAMIAVQEDPHVQIRKLAKELANSAANADDTLYVGIGGSKHPTEVCERLSEILRDEYGRETFIFSQHDENSTYSIDEVLQAKAHGLGADTHIVLVEGDNVLKNDSLADIFD